MSKFNTYKSYRYDSKWEKKLNEGIFKDLEYHPKKLKYVRPSSNHTYQPDWVLIKDGHTLYIEAKGRFRTRDEYMKYLYVREGLDPSKEELIFLFMKPDNAMPNAPRRKDGTKRSHSEWAEKNGFLWYDEVSIEETITAYMDYL